MVTSPNERVRLAELVAAMSLATDLGTGQPMEHALRTCHLSMGLAREVDVTVQELSDIFTYRFSGSLCARQRRRRMPH